MQHVFIIGSRGLPAQYGGFETFVDQLVSHQVSSDIQYHVACLSNDQAYYHFYYKGVDCFTIKAPKLGPARVIAYDMMAINYALKLMVIRRSAANCERVRIALDVVILERLAKSSRDR